MTANMPSSPSYALKLRHECGFNLFPLRPGGKEPLLPWKEYQTRAATDEEVEAWTEQWPSANWGIACGPVSDLVVVDCDNDKAADWAKSHFPETPWKVRTGRGEHWYYHYPHGKEAWLNALNVRTQFNVPIDVQRDGKYVVAPGSVHPSGKNYEQISIAPWEYVPVFDLYDDAGASASPAAPSALSGIDISNVEASYTTVGEGGRHNALVSFVGAEIASGLSPLKTLARAREHNATLFVPPLPDDEVVRIVDSIFESELKKRRAAAATAAVPSLSQQQAAPASFTVDISDPLADNPWPDDVLNPGGVLGQIVDYIEVSAIRTERVYALAGAVALMGAILGQRICTETDLAPNVYCIALGSSASGKDAPKRAIIRLMHECAPGLFAGSDVSSEVAIISHLASDHGHRACLVLDEIGMLLKACKKPNSAKAGVVRLLTELYSGYKSPYVKIYADRDRNVTISWQSLSILGLSVPEEFYGAMQDGEAVNGWLARNLVFEVRGAPRPKSYDIQPKIPAELADALKALWAIDGGEDQALPAPDGGTKCEKSPADPHRVPMDDAARRHHRVMDAQADGYAAQSTEEGNLAAASFWARAGEQAMKLALIHAASRAGASVVFDCVRLEDVTWAWHLVHCHHRRLCGRVNDALFTSEFAEVCQGVRAAIQRYIRLEYSKHGSMKPGAPYGFIAKCNRGTPPKLLKEAIEALAMQGELFLWPSWKATDKSNRAMDLYCLGHENESEPNSTCPDPSCKPLESLNKAKSPSIRQESSTVSPRNHRIRQ